jgi:hypothetical protein
MGPRDAGPAGQRGQRAIGMGDQGAHNSGEVRTVTVPGLLGREPDSVPLVIKIDIEGSEIEMFRSIWAGSRKPP